MAYKMLFDTGVRYENHLDRHGDLIRREHEEWRNNTLHIAYYLEEAPHPNWVLEYLIPEHSLDMVQENERVIKIVGGGMASDYAVFLVRGE